MGEILVKMSEQIWQKSPAISKVRAHRGQTLVIVLGVMFVLLFIGGIFVAQIARNLVSASRSRETADSKALAEAGVHYCDDQLMNSPEGADWRPVPSAPLTSTADPAGSTDPDYYWLHDLGGFTRIPMKGGRTLVRVTYEPNPEDPNSNLVKVESIGRTGEIGNGNDPTVFVQNGVSPRLRSELVGFKQIGLTDYGMFITNKTRAFSEAVIGSAPIGVTVATVLGDPTLSQYPSGFSNEPSATGGRNRLFGAAIRSNTSLKLVGDVYVFAGSRGVDDRYLPEGVMTSGSINLEATRDTNGDNVIDEKDHTAYLNQPITAVPSLTNVILASADPNYNSFNGLVRDGSTSADKNGFNRGIPRLEPPVIDTYIGGVLRYREITKNSGRWVNGSGGRYNTGDIGWGRNVYIDNRDDLQRESISGNSSGYSLRSDWLNPNAQFGRGYWQGPFYNPPGILIEGLGNRIRITRFDDKSFLLPNNQTTTAQGGKVLDIPLSDLERTNYQLPDGTTLNVTPLAHDGDEPGDATKGFGDKNSYGVNLVIMGEGNVKVKGVFGAVTNSTVSAESANQLKVGRVHLTIVTGGTAYLEGNVVKGDGYTDGANTILERASSIAILAKDYVCVNTTKFMSPQNEVNVWTRFAQGFDAFNVELGQTRSGYDMSFNWGVHPSFYQTSGTPSPLFLLLRHSALAPGPTFINLLLNPGLNANPAYQFNSPGLATGTYPLGLKYLPGNLATPVSDPSAVSPRFEQRGFPLDLTMLQTTPGYDNSLRFLLDTTAASNGSNIYSGGSTDYLLGGATVAPMDIRIEAVLYAQEKSFFIIPGYGANPDPADTRQAFTTMGARPSYNIAPDGSILDSPVELASKNAFPFFGEPIDVRITIQGAVSQNYTASSGDQAAWMARWGYIPDHYGSSGQSVPDIHLNGVDPLGTGNYRVDYSPGTNRSTVYRSPQEGAAGVARGLRYQYDPALAYPYLNPTTEDLNTRANRLQRAMRSNSYAPVVSPTDGTTVILPALKQVLPPVPRLPLCPGMLYFGETEARIGS